MGALLPVFFWFALALPACQAASSNDVEVEVRNVGFDYVANSPVVVLQNRSHSKALPIWVGRFEAQAIAMQIEGVSLPRPLTHDLMKELIERMGAVVDRVVIQDLRDSTYYALIHLEVNGRKLEIDSRPSDAIALALRVARPIFVARALMERDTVIDIEPGTAGVALAKVWGMTVQEIGQDLADALDVPVGRGVVVSEAYDDSGVRRGDVILTVNGETVGSVDELQGKLEGLKGAKVAQVGVRRGGRELNVEIRLPR